MEMLHWQHKTQSVSFRQTGDGCQKTCFSALHSVKSMLFYFLDEICRPHESGEPVISGSDNTGHYHSLSTGKDFPAYVLLSILIYIFFKYIRCVHALLCLHNRSLGNCQFSPSRHTSYLWQSDKVRYGSIIASNIEDVLFFCSCSRHWAGAIVCDLKKWIEEKRSLSEQHSNDKICNPSWGHW